MQRTLQIYPAYFPEIEIMNIRTFRPIVFRSDLNNITSPPFDVITRQQEQTLKKSQYNITHITLPESGGFAKSVQTMNKWMEEGVLEKLQHDTLIILCQDFKSGGKELSRIGLMAPVETSPDGNEIFPHEETFEWAVEERKDLMIKTGCQLEPIFLVINGAAFERVLRSAIKSLEPVRTFEEPSGVTNRVYMINDLHSQASILNSVSREKAVVADGHHRLRAAQDIYLDKPAKTKDFWKYSFSYVTSLQQDSLMISGIHRLISNDHKFSDYAERIEKYFILEKKKSAETHKGIMVYDGSFYSLEPREESYRAIGESGKYRFPADPALVNRLIFQNIMGLTIDDISRQIMYTQSVPFAIEEVDKGRIGFAFLMPPWDKSTFIFMTDSGRIFPQKSTYFYPKIPSGVAIYGPEESVVDD